MDVFLFDLDGTVTDPKEGITKSVQYALDYFGIKVENLDELTKFIGPPLWQSFGEYYGFDEEKTKIAVEKYRERYLVTGVYENFVYPGFDTMLEKLNDTGKTLLIATSKPTVVAEMVISFFELDKYFSFIGGSELNGERSDKSEVIRFTLEQNDIKDPDRCVMIGDRKHDIIGAKKAGITGIGVLYGYGDYNELSEANADYIVKDVDELSELLLSL